ncbi:hypothetical protein DN752_17725 [Echinicola strongylocentroti]|uniref:Uncharacterized protein n=1 Tax=Echinicola strongylocentroti TaxID=1795355 RepID=A0A2Z4IL38_9BACT|nr:hypothetical protein [Echinicola strongylocentroti]AWW31821.1 hypothetical protein DN752_17725 [Echinicola strongylocentroti]
MQKPKKHNLTAWEIFNIHKGLESLANLKLDPEVAWDTVQNLQSTEPVAKRYEAASRQAFSLYAQDQEYNGEKIQVIPPSKQEQYDKDMEGIKEKQESVSLVPIPFNALKIKDGEEYKVHTGILRSILPIVKK